VSFVVLDAPAGNDEVLAGDHPPGEIGMR
jgi:hypothetical protein